MAGSLVSRPNARALCALLAAVTVGCLITPNDYALERPDYAARGGAGGAVAGAGGSSGGASAGGTAAGSPSMAGTSVVAGTAGDEAIGGSGGSPVSEGGAAGINGNGGQPGDFVKRVFVTSLTSMGDLVGTAGGADGIEAANEICNSEAENLGGVWVAWLSTTTSNAPSRINDVAPWFLVDGTTEVFSSHAQLSEQPHVAIDMSESGNRFVAGRVWTGTNGGAATLERCGEWTSSSVVELGSYGDLASASAWSYSNTQYCSEQAHLYCFEQ